MNVNGFVDINFRLQKTNKERIICRAGIERKRFRVIIK